MADIDVEIVTNIEGLEELEEAFTTGSRRMIVKFLRRVEMRAAKPLVKSAQEFAPYETGRLEMEIRRMSVMDSAGGALTVRVGPNQEAFYGLFQEFGAPEVNVPALHWLENSAKEVQDEVLTEYCDAVTDGLEDLKG